MIACVNIPYFATAVERRADTALQARPLVIGGQPWEPAPVYGFSQEAAQQGVRPGMSLRLAHMLAGSAHFMPPTETNYLHASGETADVLMDFSPAVEAEEAWRPFAQPSASASRYALPVRYYVDLDSLPAGEALPLAQEVGRAVRSETRLAPAVGLARHRFTAQIAATLTKVNHVRPVAPEQESDFLAQRSVGFLPLDRETARRLRLLGIRTLGDFTAVPLAAWQEQFGAAIRPLYELACGRADYRPAQPQEPEPIIQVQQHFDDEPLNNTLALTLLMNQCAAELAGQLREAGYEGRTLHLEWRMDGEQVEPQALHLRRPTADADWLATVLNEAAGQMVFPAGIVAVTVVVSDLSRPQAQQLSLFATATAGRIEETLHNLAAKYGGDCFYRPTLLDTAYPLPERRFHLQRLDYDPLVAAG